MTDQTTDTPAPTPETETPAETAARKGRGPTRPEITFADLIGDLRRASPDVRLRVLDALAIETPAKRFRDTARLMRAALTEHVRTKTIEIESNEAAADHVAIAWKLTPDLRRAVVVILRPESAVVNGATTITDGMFASTAIPTAEEPKP